MRRKGECFTCFNPRPRAGGDVGRTTKTTLDIGFNPRPRAGGDLVQEKTAI